MGVVSRRGKASQPLTYIGICASNTFSLPWAMRTVEMLRPRSHILIRPLPSAGSLHFHRMGPYGCLQEHEREY